MNKDVGCRVSPAAVSLSLPSTGRPCQPPSPCRASHLHLRCSEVVALPTANDIYFLFKASGRTLSLLPPADVNTAALLCGSETFFYY